MRVNNDPVYRVLLERYVADLVKSMPMLEFFLEGTRSRSGKCLMPKYGMLGMVTRAVVRGAIPNARIIPVTINYEKVLEIDAIVNESMGKPKTMESFGGAITGGLKTLKQNFGSMKVCFGEDISIAEFRKTVTAEQQAAKPSFNAGESDEDLRTF